MKNQFNEMSEYLYQLINSKNVYYSCLGLLNATGIDWLNLLSKIYNTIYKLLQT